MEIARNGATSQRDSGLGIVLTTPEGDILERVVKCEWRTTNNEAEFKALVLGLQSALFLGAKSIEVYIDNQLIVNQVNGQFNA